MLTEILAVINEITWPGAVVLAAFFIAGAYAIGKLLQ